MLSPILYAQAMAVNKAGKSLLSVLPELLPTLQNGKKHHLQPADHVSKVIKVILFTRGRVKFLISKGISLHPVRLNYPLLPPNEYSS